MKIELTLWIQNREADATSNIYKMFRFKLIVNYLLKNVLFFLQWEKVEFQKTSIFYQFLQKLTKKRQRSFFELMTFQSEKSLSDRSIFNEKTVLQKHTLFLRIAVNIIMQVKF